MKRTYRNALKTLRILIVVAYIALIWNVMMLILAILKDYLLLAFIDLAIGFGMVWVIERCKKLKYKCLLEMSNGKP